MGSVCAEHHNKPSSLFSPKNKSGLDIPPRKLLSRRAAAAAASADPAADMTFLDSPRGFEKFLPYNSSNNNNDSSSSDESDSDPYSSDHFRMYEFKVRRCTRSRSHDWTDCPFAHPGEKARRRDPRRFHYSGTVCSEFRRGSCSRGDNCEFAHGVFECWLHPSRYRTEACKDGKNCKRKVCFFAHSQRELRILPLDPTDNSPSDPTTPSGRGGCCLFCHQPAATSASPTSTLISLSHLSSPPVSPSHSLSPPLSPMTNNKHGRSSLLSSSRYADRLAESAYYKEVLNEIMGSLDATKINAGDNIVPGGNVRNKRNVPWVNVAVPGDEPATQFVLSPAAPSPGSMPRDSFAYNVDGGLGYMENYSRISTNGSGGGEELAAASDPDLGWVNDLLM